jgi:hypothetical protein
VNFLHHTSWQVDDIDDVGRGAKAMLQNNPERHIWGLGRHHAGSNFFWYLKDPAGNFSEYYSDMDCIPEDEIWTPETFEGAQGLFNWGPPPPPSFLEPDDLAALMTGTHAPGTDQDQQKSGASLFPVDWPALPGRTRLATGSRPGW